MWCYPFFTRHYKLQLCLPVLVQLATSNMSDWCRVLSLIVSGWSCFFPSSCYRIQFCSYNLTTAEIHHYVFLLTVKCLLFVRVFCPGNWHCCPQKLWAFSKKWGNVESLHVWRANSGPGELYRYLPLFYYHLSMAQLVHFWLSWWTFVMGESGIQV